MTYRKLGRFMGTAVLLVLMAPAAQAQGRDTGVGREIAEQGNIALRLIRAQSRLDTLHARPSLVDVRVRRTPEPMTHLASAAGPAYPATSVRAAE